MCADLPPEAHLAEAGGVGREMIAARLTAEIGSVDAALATAAPAAKNELILLVECLRAARQVMERSASLTNARD